MSKGHKISILLTSVFICFYSCSTHKTSNTRTAREVASANDVFNNLKNLRCSPEKQIGCSGLFSVHESDNTEIGLLINGEASLISRLRTLKAAKKSIRIQALIMKADEAGKRIAKILIQKKKEGKIVQVIVDAFSNLDLETQLMYYDLKMAGIEVEGYEAGYLQWLNEVTPKDLQQPNKRFHDKMWIIDGEDLQNRVAIIGGMNIANEYFRIGATEDKVWRDQDFIVKGDMIADIVKAFDRNYADQKAIKESHLINTDKTWSYWKKLISSKLTFHIPKKQNPKILAKLKKLEEMTASPEVETKRVKALFIQNRPRYDETYIEQAYQRLISNAQDEVLLSNAYFIPSKETIEALKLAARNGASVKIITNSPETNDLPQMSYASRYLYEDLLNVNFESNTKGKLEIYEWAGQRFHEGTNHAKFAVIDGRTIIGGSYNLDPRSEKLNSETVVVFEQVELAQKLATFIKSNDLKKVVPISMQQARIFHDPKNPPDFMQLLIWNGLKGML